MEVLDKSWLTLRHDSLEFRSELTSFSNMLWTTPIGEYPKGKLPCLCTKCTNMEILPISELRMHVIMNGWLAHYVDWAAHGEPYSRSKRVMRPSTRLDESIVKADMCGLVYAAMGRHQIDPVIDRIENLVPIAKPNDVELEGEIEESLFDQCDDTFFKRLKEGEEELYDGCTEFMKLSFMLELYQIKCLNQWTNTLVFEMFLSFLHRAIPKNMYERKLVVKYFGLKYDKIDACYNHCILCHNEFRNVDSCPTCGIVTSNCIT